MVTAETEKLNNEQNVPGFCSWGSGAVWDSILRSAFASCLADDEREDDGMHQNHDQNKVAAAADAGVPELVAIETLPAMLYSVAVPDDAPVVPVPTVPAEEAIKMIKTTDRAPVQAEAEELTSGEEPTNDAHASTVIVEIAAPVACKAQAETRHGVSFALGMRTSNDTMSVECRGATPTWLGCAASPRSTKSPRCPLTRGFAATRCPLTVVGVFHWEE